MSHNITASCMFVLLHHAGWNIPYDFSQGDLAAVTQFLQVCTTAACTAVLLLLLLLRRLMPLLLKCCKSDAPKLVQKLSTSPFALPLALHQTHISDMDARRAAQPDWPTVRYMIADIQYAGRITDDFDRLLMVRGWGASCSTVVYAEQNPSLVQPPHCTSTRSRPNLQDTYAEQYYQPEVLHKGAQLFRDERTGTGVWRYAALWGSCWVLLEHFELSGEV